MRAVRTALVSMLVSSMVVGPMPARAGSIVDVRPGALHGWEAIHERPGGGTPAGSHSFVTGPATPSGAGSLYVTAGDEAGSNEGLRFPLSETWSELSSLSYTTYTPTGSTWPLLMR